MRSKLLAHYLGAKGVGFAAEVNQIVALAGTLGAFASGPALTRHLGECSAKNDWGRYARVTRSAMSLALLTSIFTGSISLAIAPWLLPGEAGPLLWWVGLSALAAIFAAINSVVVNAHVVLVNMRAVTISSIASTALGTLVTAVLVWRYGLHGQFIAIAIGSVFTVSIALSFSFPLDVPRRLGLTRSIEPEFLRDAFTLGGTAMLAAFAWQLLFYTIRATLQSVGGAADGARFNGWYQAAFGASYIYMSIAASSCTGYYYPRFAGASSQAELLKEVDDAFRFVLRLLIPIALLGIGLRRPLIRLLYSSDFDMAGDILGYEMAGDILKGVAWVPTGLLLMTGRAHLALLSEISGVTIGIIVNVLMVRRFGPIGAGLGHLVSYSLFAPVSLAFARRVVGDIVSFRPVITAAAAAAGSAVVAGAGSRWPWANLFAIAAAVVYAHYSGLLADGLVRFRRIRDNVSAAFFPGDRR